MKPILLIITLTVLILTACGTAAPVETEAPPPIETQVSIPTENIEATPETPGGGPYPGAVEPTESDQNVAPPYPGPEENVIPIEWEEATSMILDGKIVQVTQYENLMVVLVLEDGQKMSTRQPGLDAVLGVIDECGDKCKDIEVIPN